MNAFLLHEYWDRLWIIQEVLLGSEVLVYCGTHSVPFSHLQDFFRLVTIFRRQDRFAGSLAEVMNSSLALLVSRRNDSTKSPPEKPMEHPLLYLVSDHANAQCMDERDRIFGLCSLAMPCCVIAVPVDYSRSYSEISEICDMVLAHHCIYHADEIDGAIRDSRYFHHALRITSKQYQKSPESDERWDGARDQIPELVEDYSVAIRANIASRIIWLSPILTNPIPPKDFHCPPLPDFGQMVLKSLHQAIFTTFNGALPIATQFDLVRPILTRGCHSIKSCGQILTPLTSVTSMTWSAIMRHAEKYPNPSTAIPYKDRLKSALAAYGVELFSGEWKTVSSKALDKADRERKSGYEFSSESTADLIGSDELEDMAFQVLNAIRDVVPVNRRSLLRIAIDEIGVIYLMPFNTKLRDLVCQFPHTDITLLARQGQQSSGIGLCSIEGQGQELLVSDNKKFVKSTNTSFFEPKHGLFDGHRQITHEVEIRTPLSLLKAISVESAAADVPKWRWNRLIEQKGISLVRGIHVCDFLPGNCSSISTERVKDDSDFFSYLRSVLLQGQFASELFWQIYARP
ncbi:hypothetical protein DL98DRAFT_590703 [Cadophora sp. DSE1049]|nr:hypothetical protein DL98DRAFT_590703 [Cadophora sp. DSE1049]